MYPGNKLAILALIFAAISLRGQAASAETVYGEAKKLGNGFARLYAELEANGAPRVFGVTFVEGMLEGLPAVPNTYSRCFDKNGDGKIGARGECNGDFELIFPLPREVGNGQRCLSSGSASTGTPKATPIPRRRRGPCRISIFTSTYRNVRAYAASGRASAAN
jgi:hypothetical protein